MLSDFIIRTVISSLLGHRQVPEAMVERHRRFGSIQALRLHLMRQPRFLSAVASLQDATLQNPLDIGRKVIVFQHIPKCGGTSLHRLLESSLGEAFSERYNGLGNWPALALAGTRFFSGHFDSPSLALIPPADLRIVTMLREPKKRLVSLYRYLRATQPNAGAAQNRNMELVRLARAHEPEVFFAHPDLVHHPSIHNAMTRQLAEPLRQKSWESFYPMKPPPGLTDTEPDVALAQAIEHLRNIAAVALLEELPLTLPPLMKALDLNPTTKLTHENSMEDNMANSRWFEPVPKVMLTRALEEVLAPHIELDRKLYYGAIKLLSKRGIL